MCRKAKCHHIYVICRIGSLENVANPSASPGFVICRIGSLETSYFIDRIPTVVICRIGSLEIEKIKEADKK